MAIKTSDGKEFTHPGLARRHEANLREQQVEQSTANRSQHDVEDAPGGEEHVANLKAHGTVIKSTIEFEGNGRWRHTATHDDGSESTSVHPQWFRAHELQAKYFDPDGKPGALETHQRARSQPTGPKEEERIAREDGRVSPEDDD